MDKRKVLVNINGCMKDGDQEGAMRWINYAGRNLPDKEFLWLCNVVLNGFSEKHRDNQAYSTVAISIANILKKVNDKVNAKMRRRRLDDPLGFLVMEQENKERLERVRRGVEERLETKRREAEIQRERVRRGAERRHERERKKAEENQRKKLELEKFERQRREAELRDAKVLLRYAGRYNESLSDKQVICISEDLTRTPTILSRNQHRRSIEKLQLSIDDDHFLTRVYRELYRRVAHCFRCGGELDNSIDKECEACGWIVCNCGACGCQYENR